ncbi:MAG: guanylate kinase, partial [Clostridia bacterium]|nr:guanylate kinase [Clostridia bacterium]
EQERRLRDRGRDSEESILRRLERAKDELKQIELYDYILVNETGKADETVNAMRAITAAEMNAVARTPRIYDQFFGE